MWERENIRAETFDALVFHTALHNTERSDEVSCGGAVELEGLLPIPS